MGEYTKEEFERAWENYQNANRQLEEIAYQMEEAENDGREFDVNTIEDERIRQYVTEMIKAQRGEITEEEAQNLTFGMLEQYFEFDRFTDENWKSFVNDYDIKAMVYEYMNNFNENAQLGILSAMAEDGYADLSKFSKETINAGFVNAIEKKNKNLADRLLSDTDEGTILGQYEEIEKIYREDKEGLSKVYNKIRGEIAQERPELIEQTLIALKGTSHAYIPWMDASAKVQNDNKDLLPEIISMRPNVATSIWEKTDDFVKKEKFKDVVDAVNHIDFNEYIPYDLWKHSNKEVRNDSLDVLPKILNNASRAKEIWESIDEKQQDEILLQVFKECNHIGALRIIFDEVGNKKIEERFDELLEIAPYNLAQISWIYNTEENKNNLKDYLPKLIEKNDEFMVEELWSKTSEEIKIEKFDEVYKRVKDDAKKIHSVWLGLNENLEFQKVKFPQLIEQANGNIEQIISIWSGTNAKLQNDNVMEIYNLAKNSEQANELDIERLLKNTHIDSILKLYDELEDIEKKQVLPGICKALASGTQEDRRTLEQLLEKEYPSVNTEKLSDLLMMEDGSYIGRQMLENVLIENTNEDNIMNIKFISSEIDKYHQIFFTNNLPEVFKLHQFFLLHENHLKTNVELYPNEISIEKRDKLMLGDLFLSALESNNKQMRNFLEIMHNGDILIEKIKNGKNRSELDNAIILQYRDSLYDMFNYKSQEKLDVTENVYEDIEHLRSKLKCSDREKLGDRLINDFFEEIELQLKDNMVVDGTTTGYLLEYMDDKLHKSFERNVQEINVKELLSEGDLIKGTNIVYLQGQLRNGIRSKEFNMVGTVETDATPFDADFSEIKRGNVEGKTNLMDVIRSTFTSTRYGSTYLVIGKDDYDKEKSYAIEDGNESTRYLRTAVGSTRIKGIITNEWDEKYAYSMAQEGIYIPVIDSQTEQVIFTKEQYKAIREEMKGMTFYRAGDFEIDKNVENEVIMKEVKELREKARNEIAVEEEKNKIVEEIERMLPNAIVQNITGEVSNQYIELIDIGSTGRGTSVPGEDIDFDFIVKCKSQQEQKDVIYTLSKGLNGTDKGGTDELNIRYGDVIIDGVEKPVDIDITSEKMSLAVEYSSDMCIKDVYQNIEKVYGKEKLQSVKDNVIVAKKVLKDAGVYKRKESNKSTPFGGFGGIGVENWIIQNGGSFILAMESFLDNTKDKDGNNVSFPEFLRKYPIYNFGQNHRQGNAQEEHAYFSEGLSQERL